MEYRGWSIDRLEELLGLWNQEIGHDFPMSAELFKQNSFDDCNVFTEGSHIAINQENQVVGFVVAKRWQDEIDVGISKEMGWIQVLLVDRHYRNQGIGKKLLQHAESSLKESGVNHIWLGKDTWHYFPGVPFQYEDVANWFEKRGYEKGTQEYDLDCHFEEDEIGSPSLDGVEHSLLKLEEKDEFLSFMHRCFPGRWEYEAIQYFQKGGQGREFVVLKRNNQIIGFCRINDSKSPVIAQNVYWSALYQQELGGIGPLGIDLNERKHGYGLFIVEAAVSYLHKRHIRSMLIDWTGLVTFYNKLGFEVCKSYNSYFKKI
ncbi:GNAT family N-acetyltransferase [Bacillus timonensis]|uniref:GNAT family N-acetyltransferase n=1 Tax=Bacillus timonensis TaxID=1033734 RepID=A0A4S3PVE0_9BACI|nr:GNAT family N-acetyltransferase [Bacillus timonensis]THE13787.1 GNAT family N-acetyltransferase [Bacillus timonensis]